MSDFHGQGPPRSTTADVMSGIIGAFAAVGDPTTFYVGERYLKQEGAPPRIVLVRGSGTGVGYGAIARGYVSGFAQEFVAYIWGSETPLPWQAGVTYLQGAQVASNGGTYSYASGPPATSGASSPTGGPTGSDGVITWTLVMPDLARYGASEAMLDRYVNVIGALIPGRYKYGTIDPNIETNVVTYGEDLQVHVTWTRGIPRDAAVTQWSLTQAATSPPDPSRPQGNTGTNVTVTVSAEAGASR